MLGTLILCQEDQLCVVVVEGGIVLPLFAEFMSFFAKKTAIAERMENTAPVR